MTRRTLAAARLTLREWRRRRFLGQAQGLQANGYPALETCQYFDSNTLLFLDNRMTGSIFLL
jgi:hypothetical protein